MTAKGSARLTWTLFTVLLREEWRLHTQLFGGMRFLSFPALLSILTAAGGLALTATTTDTDTVLIGIYSLVFVFGLYSGTAGFAGSDMLENVFGRLTLVLSSAKTLPIAERRLLTIFLVKDGLFYAVVFVLPITLGTAVLAGGETSLPLWVGAVWLSLSLVFAAGMALTVSLIALRTRGVPGSVLALGILGVLAGVVLTGVGFPTETLIPWLPLEAALGLAIFTLGLGTLSLLMYNPAYTRETRTTSGRFTALTTRLPLEEPRHSALVTKTLLDLSRSSGGVFKPVVSVVILFGLVAALVAVVADITGIEPAPGIFFGGVLGLSAFTTYNWLTQFDSVEAYLAYPVAVEDVFAAKRTAFVLVGAPTVALPYLLAVVWFDATALDALVGGLLLCGYGLYYYGLTVFIAGFDPNEFLFDAVRFSVFTIGVAVALLPALVAGFVIVPPTTSVAGGLAILGVGFGLLGYLLSSRAGPRWAHEYRQG